MSRARVSDPTEVQAFLSMLRPVEVTVPKISLQRGRLGRTAEAVERARVEGLEQGHRQGYDEGFAQGKVDGAAAIRSELAAATQAEIDEFGRELGRVVENVKQAMGEWFVNAEAALAPLALKIAREVIGHELEISEAATLAIVRKAMAEVTHAPAARIRVNPSHSELLRDHVEAIRATAPSVKELIIVDDAAIAGGCIIETDGGIVDANVDAQIGAIREAMRGAA